MHSQNLPARKAEAVDVLAGKRSIEYVLNPTATPFLPSEERKLDKQKADYSHASMAASTSSS